MGWRSGGSLGNSLINRKTMKDFLDALVAVLAGNAIYYLLMPHLPEWRGMASSRKTGACWWISGSAR